jgi:hypothetical protein
VDVESVGSFEQTLQFQGDQNAADKHLAVRFSWDEVEDPVETAKQGRPIFKSVEFCEIRVPGDRDGIIKDRIKYMHPDPRERFPQAYAKFKAGDKQQVVGTPLREWQGLTRAQARSYEAANIFTVEQLASLGDNHAQTMFGSIGDRQKARDFLAQSAGQAPLTQARAEIEKMREEIRNLRDQVAGLPPRPVEDPTEPPRRKPGRPRKNPIAEG